MNIGFIGNFIPKHSTENDRKWSFEQLGHNVITFQENKTSAQELVDRMGELDVLFYSHTHDPSYVIPRLREVFDYYKLHKVPTVSVHLDRWIGLQRVKDMGNEATWFTEFIFMADGSPEAAAKYDSLGLNWFYLKPGVIQRDCYMAQPDPVAYPHEIVFVGSKGYHPEYPFRPQLITFLQETYGDRFGHYGNDGIKPLRGHELNVLYATAKIAVGDSCFGGRTRYVSDRYYETRGRGGLLLHPQIEGVDNVGVINYPHGSLEGLRLAIDTTLAMYRPYLREEGFNHVRQYETYTNRAQEMLGIIFK